MLVIGSLFCIFMIMMLLCMLLMLVIVSCSSIGSTECGCRSGLSMWGLIGGLCTASLRSFSGRFALCCLTGLCTRTQSYTVTQTH